MSWMGASARRFASCSLSAGLPQFVQDVQFPIQSSTPGLHPTSTKKSRVAGVMDPCLHPKITAVPDQVLSFLSSQRWDDKYRAYGIEDSVHLFRALLSEPSPRRMTLKQLALPFYGLQKSRSTNQQSRIRMRLHQANRESRLRNFSYQRIRLETFLDSESNRLGPRVWVSCFLLEVVGPPSTETGRGVATRGIGATRICSFVLVVYFRTREGGVQRYLARVVASIVQTIVLFVVIGP